MTETIAPPPVAPTAAERRPGRTDRHDDTQPRVLQVSGFHDKFLALAENTLPAATGGRP